MTATSQSESTPSKGSHLGLYLLLGAIVLGVLVGAFSGRRMWLASGGPQAALEKLADIRKQKEVRLEEDKQADKTAAAEHLQEQLPKIDAEMDRLKALAQE